MKKINVFILALLFVQQLSAFNLYDQLCQFNFNWKKYELRAPAGEARNFYSDKEYIQAHLTCVLEILRSNPVAQLNSQQLASRIHLIGVLDNYRSAGIFPLNYYRHERIPVFIDENKTHCAVGFLLQQTGHEDMALRISAADNYAWLKDTHDPEFPAWQKASGFSMEELKLIQGAYDFYRRDAFISVDKYRIPQKPSCMLVYFENRSTQKPMDAKPENIWCYGEGANGVLNGKWVQNYACGMPWIVGYYENGQRTGQWQEYFQGTKKLCRTENWRNNKLNGIRKRFDQATGRLIEEILFKDGKAVLKKNHDLLDSLTYVRRPLDSNLVWTEVYNFEGSLIAAGKERIYNPDNLQWFQNIPLTALNSASIQARDAVSTFNNPYLSQQFSLYNAPALVQFKKEGDWTYFREYFYAAKTASVMQNVLLRNYHHYGHELQNSLSVFDNVKMNTAYDSIHVIYMDNYLRDFVGYGNGDFLHLHVSYYAATEIINIPLSYQNSYSAISYYGYSSIYGHPLIIEASAPVAKECGQYNKAGERIGDWKHFSTDGQLYKMETYLVAWKEDDDEKK